MQLQTDELYEVQFETKVTAMGCSAFGHVSNISESGISVELPFKLNGGNAVELLIADSTIYGHVIDCQAATSSFRTGIQATRVALGGTSLSSILQRVLMRALPLIPGLDPPAEAHRRQTSPGAPV